MRAAKTVLCALLLTAVGAFALDVNAGYGSGTVTVSGGGCYGSSNYSATYNGTASGGMARQADGSYRSPDESPNMKVQTARYFLSRWYDLCDVVDFSFGAGPGFRPLLTVCG